MNKKLVSALKGINYELIYIDDGSSDKTLEKMRLVSKNNKEKIRYISFSRNFGKEAAMNAGLTLHVRQITGSNAHHIIEGIFKSLARTLKKAVAIDGALNGAIPSTKGVL